MAKTASQIIQENQRKQREMKAVADSRREIQAKQLNRNNGTSATNPVSAAGQKQQLMRRQESERVTAPVAKTAAQKRDEAQKLYDDYLKSDEYKQNQVRSLKAQTDEWMNAAMFGSEAYTPGDHRDKKEQRLKALVDHYTEQAKQEEAQTAYDRDLQELEGWSEEDRAALEEYLSNRRDAFVKSLNPAMAGLPADFESNPLIAKYGRQRLDEIAETYRSSRNTEKYRQAEQTGRDMANRGAGSAAAGSGLSVAANLADTLLSPLGRIADMPGSTGRYKNIDPYGSGDAARAFSAGVRGQTAQNIEGEGGFWGKAGSLLYQGGMSALDSAARATVGGSGAVGAGLAALGTFNQTLSDASARGANPTQALALATVNAGIEALSEKLPLDNLLKLGKAGTRTLMGTVKEILKQMGIEAMEEEVSLIGTTLAEAAILQDKSSYNLAIAQAMTEGKTEAQARREANLDLLRQAGETLAVSAFAAGFGASGAQLMGRTADGLGSRRAGTDTRSEPETQPEPQGKPEAEKPEVREHEPEPREEKPQRPAKAPSEAPPADSWMQETFRQPEQKPRQQPVQQPVRQPAAPVQTQAPRAENAPAENAPQAAAAPQTAGEVQQQTPEPQAQQPAKAAPANPAAAQADAAPEQEQHGRELGSVSFQYQSIHPEASHFTDEGSGGFRLYEDGTVEPDSKVIGRVNDLKGWRDQGLLYLYQPQIDGKNIDPYADKLPGGYYGVGQILKRPRVERTTGGYVIREKGVVTLEKPGSKPRTAAQPVAAAQPQAEQKETASSLPGDAEAPSVTPDNAAKIDAVTDNSLPENGTEAEGDTDENRAREADRQEASAQGGQSGGAPQDTGDAAAQQDSEGAAGAEDVNRRSVPLQRSRPDDVRPMNVPVRDPQGQYVTEAAGNMYGSGLTSDTTARLIEDLVASGDLGFDVRSNSDSLKRAHEAIYGTEEKKGRGEYAARSMISRHIGAGKIQDGDIEQALLMYAQYAGDPGKRAQNTAAELIVDLGAMANMTGRNLQLFKMLRRMTPQGQLMAVQKNVARYVDSLNAGRFRKQQVQAEIPAELEKEFLTATTEEQREKAQDAIYKCVAAQIPSTLEEKWDAWRNLAMLGNPKTHIRNFGGSAAFRPYVSVKRAIGAAIEQKFVDQENRTKAILGLSENDRALLRWARADAGSKEAQSFLDYSGTTGNEARNAIEDARRILPGKLEDVRRKNMELMEGADMLFKKAEYASSLASFLKARGYSSAQVEAGTVPKKVMEAGRELAVKEAMKATFNDRNRFSDAIAKFRFKGADPASRVANVVAKGLMPFTRTPANVLVRAKEYSAVEIGRSLDTLTRKVKAGEATVTDGIDQLASGLTGTGAMLLGIALASGLIPGFRLVGKIEDEEEKRNGAQEYSLKAGDAYLGISWLAPANIPLFIGANLYQSLSRRETGESPDAWDILSGIVETCTDMIDPMLELSCLSALADAVETASYEDSTGNWLLSVAASAATNYFTQGIPTIFGQAEQAMEDSRKTTYSSADNPLQRAFERTVGNTMKRLPGDLYQAEKLDRFGNSADMPGNGLTQALDAFFNPFTLSREQHDPVTEEIARLHKVQPEAVSPPQIPKSISYTDAEGNQHTDYRLSAKEYTALAKAQGQTAHKILETILENETYQAMSDEQKADVFDRVYDYAREKARTEALTGYAGMSDWMMGIEGNEADAIINKAVTGAFTDAFDMLDRDSEGAAAAMEQAYGLLGGSTEREKEFAEAAGGRVKYFMAARRVQVQPDTFLALYSTFRDIDEQELSTSEKAGKWAYALERARETGVISEFQKDAMKDAMVYYQMFPAETVKFDQMTEAGISADDAVQIGKLLEGITPQKGYSDVRDVQKAQAIAQSGLSDPEMAAVMRVYLPENQDENLEQMMTLGYSPEEYAAAYGIYANESGTGKKARIIRKIRETFGVEHAEAVRIYEIYG